MYTKTNWQPGPAGGTPVTAARLNKLETQFDEAVLYFGAHATSRDVTAYGAKGDGTTSDDVAINAALAGGNAVVYFPAGDYLIRSYLRLYANTRVILHPDAVLLNDNLTSEYVFVNGDLGNTTYATGYTGAGNISISGGTIDNGLRAARSQMTQAIAIGHAENVLIENMTFRNNFMSHFVEINSSRRVTIRNCSFTNLNPNGDSNREAINIDYAFAVGFPPFGSYDNTSCDNILIDGCRFVDVPVGVGTHSAPPTSHTNLRVRACTFLNMGESAVRPINWRSGSITDCLVDGSGYESIRVADSFDLLVHGNDLRNGGTLANNLYTVISIVNGSGCYAGNNRISSTHANKYSAPYGITNGTGHRFDTQGADVGANGFGINFNADQAIVDGGYLLRINDDQAASIRIPGRQSQGLAFIATQSNTASAPRGVYWVRGDSAPACMLVAAVAGANITLTTGALTGTTGTDTNMTVSGHTDGRLYIENRSGGVRYVTVTFNA